VTTGIRVGAADFLSVVYGFESKARMLVSLFFGMHISLNA
jgi:hypothetical protein